MVVVLVSLIIGDTLLGMVGPLRASHHDPDACLRGN